MLGAINSDIEAVVMEPNVKFRNDIARRYKCRYFSKRIRVILSIVNSSVSSARLNRRPKVTQPGSPDEHDD